jgi:hypothetical protein
MRRGMRSGMVTGGEGERSGVVWRRRVIVFLLVWLLGMVGTAIVRVMRVRIVDRRKGRGCILGRLCLRLKGVKCGGFGLKEIRLVEARIVHEKCGCKYYDRLRSFLG